MKKEDVQGKKLNNKGFSLVEIIIVIAIMAILAGALAPQLMKYVEKSRKAADANNCNAIKTAVMTTLANESAYDSIDTSKTITFNTNPPDKYSDGSTIPAAFINELDGIIGTWPSVKEKGKTGFQIHIDGDKNVTVQTVPTTPTPTPTPTP